MTNQPLLDCCKGGLWCLFFFWTRIRWWWGKARFRWGNLDMERLFLDTYPETWWTWTRNLHCSFYSSRFNQLARNCRLGTRFFLGPLLLTGYFLCWFGAGNLSDFCPAVTMWLLGRWSGSSICRNSTPSFQHDVFNLSNVTSKGL